ncbi:guanylate kinase [Oceanibium sediminis]|uniref:guanylate kinase n=1 Tax=Oceanibium sediminis TaxID=2026339 RepID=UPI000DD4111A|nr:guanylate kinase [Oceanibium sediminis]
MSSNAQKTAHDPRADRRGLLIILSSPSGAGKSTLSRRLRAEDPTIAFSVSATTRPPRPGEVDGKDYHFMDVERFRAMVADGQMLEHAEVFGNLYGSPRGPVEAAIDSGSDVLFDVDWQGGQQIKESPLGQQVVSIFLLPPSMAELEARLRARGQDSDAVIADRMRKSQSEISHWAEYDYVLINADLDKCEAQITAILEGERLRRARQPHLMRHVQKLNTEFEGMNR